MRYVSTRGAAPVLGFDEAMLTGLARDGGLYVPETVPHLTADEIAALAGQSYEDVAFRVMRPFVGGAFTDAELQGAILRAYAGFDHAARAPLSQIGSNHFLLELYHGPTLAFKDFAMQVIGQLFQIALARGGRRITIVGATSGDTGSAAIEAFRGLANVDVVILYPHGRVSDVQRRQMTTPAEANVHALAIDGTFDDAQARLKDMFNDFAFRDEVGLAGVHSINWARIVAQIVYYVTAAVSLGAPRREVAFTVPTGNFGDIFAGYGAVRMGLPVTRLVIATNVNDILARTLATGRYELRGVTATTSPSMDIQVSSNFERLLFEAYGGDAARIRRLMADLADKGAFAIDAGPLSGIRGVFAAGTADEAATAAAMRETFRATGFLADPHTAVGLAVAEKHRSGPTPMVTLSTAHPAKFPRAVVAATGVEPSLPEGYAGLLSRDEHFTVLANDRRAVEDFVMARARAVTDEV